MAEKVVVVRLKAVVDDYKKAFGDASSATDDLVKKAGNIQSLGQSTAALGASLTRNVTLPIVALGGVATKMAADFDASFVRMQTLAGVTAGEVDGMKESVLALAGETGRAPQELSEALYFLSSSGLDSSDALDALEMSAKAAATGMGSTVQIADAVSSAMNAYAASNLSAAEATDVLVATAKAGKVEPAELAAQMGRLLPMASELGITFKDVGGAIAALSLQGNDAAASTTLLSNVMTKLLKPSQQGAEELLKVGTSIGEIQARLKGGESVQSVLGDLRDRLGEMGFRKFLEDTQAINGALALTSDNAGRTDAAFDAVAGSAGDADKAFATWADSMGAENAQAWAKMQVAMIEFGDVLAPIVADVLGFAADVISAFSDMPEPLQKAVIGFLAIAAAAGPTLSVLGSGMTIVGTVRKAFEQFANTLTNQAAAAINQTGTTAAGSAGGISRFGAAAATAATGVGILLLAVEGFDRLRPKIDANIGELENDLLDFAESGKLGGEAARVLGEDLDKLAGAFERVHKPSVQTSFTDSLLGGLARDSHLLDDAKDRINALDDALAQLAGRDPDAARQQFDAVKDALVEMGVSSETVDSEMDNYREAMAQAATQSELTGGAVDGLGGALGEAGDAADIATEALKQYLDAVAAQFDPLFGMVDALEATADAQVDVRQKTADLDTAIRDYGAGSAEAQAAQEALTDAQNSASRTVIDLHSAATTLRHEMEVNGLTADQAARQFVDMAVQMGFTEGEAYQMASALGFAAGEATRLGAEDPTVNVGVSGAEEARMRLLALREAALSVPQRIHIGVTGYGHIPGRAVGGPVRAGEVYTVGERGPEFFVPDRAGRIIPEADTAAYSSPMMAAANWSGGETNTTIVNVSMAGAIIASQSDAQRWVAEAWNRAADSGRVNIKGRRL